ncbi:hypothetical protein ACFL54_04650 [Planctomycetota bacterium]
MKINLSLYITVACCAAVLMLVLPGCVLQTNKEAEELYLVEVNPEYMEKNERSYSDILTEHGRIHLVAGKTTQQQIIAWYGKPHAKETISQDSSEKWSYYLDKSMLTGKTADSAYTRICPYISLELWFEGGVVSRYHIVDLSK